MSFIVLRGAREIKIGGIDKAHVAWYCRSEWKFCCIARKFCKLTLFQSQSKHSVR